MTVPRTSPHLRRGEIVAGLSAVVLLVVLFLVTWVATGPAGHEATPTGFGGLPLLRWFALITGLLGLAVAALQATMRAPALPAALDVVTTTFAALTTLLVIIRLLFGSGEVWGGAIIGLIACAGVTAGAFMALRQEDGWIPGPEHPVETVRVGPASLD